MLERTCNIQCVIVECRICSFRRLKVACIDMNDSVNSDFRPSDVFNVFDHDSQTIINIKSSSTGSSSRGSQSDDNTPTNIESSMTNISSTTTTTSFPRFNVYPFQSLQDLIYPYINHDDPLINSHHPNHHHQQRITELNHNNNEEKGEGDEKEDALIDVVDHNDDNDVNCSEDEDQLSHECSSSSLVSPTNIYIVSRLAPVSWAKNLGSC